MNKVSTDIILNWISDRIENKKPIEREEWLDIAFKLNGLRIEEAKLYNKIKQTVAQKKLEIL